MAISFWENNIVTKEANLTIIGCGYTGLFSALFLKNVLPGLKINIVDKLPYGAAASTRNAGFACFGSVGELLDDIQSRSITDMVELVRKRWKGLQRLKELVPESVIGFEKSGGYEIFYDNAPAGFPVEEKIAFLNEALLDIFGKEVFQLREPITPRWEHCIHCSEEGQLNPGALWDYLLQRASRKGCQFFPATKITRLELSGSTKYCFSEFGLEFSSNAVLLASNGFSSSLVPQLRVSPARNNVILSNELPGITIKGSYHADRGYIYFRQLGSRLLIGGGRHWQLKSENTESQQPNLNICNRLTTFAQTYIPGAQSFKPSQIWTGTMGLGPSKTPIVEMLKPGLFAAVRLGGMGVAISNLVASEMAAQIVSYFGSSIKTDHVWEI